MEKGLTVAEVTKQLGDRPHGTYYSWRPLSDLSARLGRPATEAIAKFLGVAPIDVLQLAGVLKPTDLSAESRPQAMLETHLDAHWALFARDARLKGICPLHDDWQKAPTSVKTWACVLYSLWSSALSLQNTNASTERNPVLTVLEELSNDPRTRERLNSTRQNRKTG